ncbi:hypothetical protein IAT38_005999 [Cryptococcus sp. DSM 104549]
MSGLLDSVFGGADADTDPDTGADRIIDEEPEIAMSSSSSSSVSSSVRATSTAAVTTSAISSTISSSAVATPNPATPTTSRTSSTSSSILSSAVTSTTSARSTISSSAVTSTRTSSTSTSTRTSTTSTSTRSTRTSTHSSSTTSTHSSSSSTTSTSSSSTATASSTAIAANTKGGIGGSGLSVGALVGIIIGCIVALILIAVLATRQIRKRARADRRKRRSSMFEWPQTGMEHDPYEKPRYDPPSESYAMADNYGNNAAQSVSYPTNETVYAPVPAESSTPMSYMERHNPQPSYRNSFQNAPMNSAYPSYPPQAQYPAPGQGHYAQNFAGAGAGAAVGAGAVGAGVASAAMAPAGASAHGALAGGMWASVKVGFVRSLEDELAVTPGQKLYLHAVYDDDWCLCEDDSQRKGVVPVSCLEPFKDSLAPAAGGAGMERSASGQSISATSERRSSLLPPGKQ